MNIQRSYDAAKRKIAGRFEGTLAKFGTSTTVEVTSGFFTYCAWTRATVKP